MNVTDLLTAKSKSIITVKPTDTVATLCEVLRDRKIGAVVVSSDGLTIDGLISERDVARAVPSYGARLANVPVSEIMTRDVVTCAPHDNIAFVASTMLTRNFRHMPVVVDGVVVGMTSMRDVLDTRLSDLQQQSAQLRAAAHAATAEPQDRE